MWRYCYGADLYEGFVKKINETAWVPDAKGDLKLPKFVSFDTLGWEENPLLQSKIIFQPPVIESLAREAGIEPETLDLIKEYDVSPDQLRELLGVKDERQEAIPHPGTTKTTHSQSQAAKVMLGPAAMRLY